MITVVMIGILGAIAIPQFIKIRTRSQDSAVLNNLRQLGNASSQYFLQNGVSLASYSDLVGSDKYIKNMGVLASETYPVSFTQGVAITVTGVGGDRTLTYQP
jgi:type II secretory pathway pseudopilin PulG